MTDSTENNKRIARNTLFLYLRMLITLSVSLFTVRVILKTLGIEDYGIYNVVAGFVTSFSFIANTTSTAIQRFLSYCLGQKRYDEYRKYFINSFTLFIILSCLAIILLETIGLWFLQEKMVIPPNRYHAAIWIYQSAIITLFFSFISIPYNAVILSNEKMSIFAYLSIIDVINKLLIVYLLTILPFDHLKTYAILLSIVGFLNFLLYKYFANRICKYITLSFKCKSKYIKSLLSFTGWNLIGSISGLCRNQGINILINLYFGPIYNAACGISFQIYNAINGFASNFMIAVNPQIVKLYATNQKEELDKLIERSSKMSFSLLMLIAYPFLVLMPNILKVWLHTVPEITILFARLILINMLIECVSTPLLILAQATGKLKKYQITVGGLLILNLPISWLMLKFFHTEAYIIFIILISINIIALFARIVILSQTAELNAKSFIFNVISKWSILLLICITGFYVTIKFNLQIQIISTIFFTFITIPIFILFIVFNRFERNSIFNYIKNKLKQ